MFNEDELRNFKLQYDSAQAQPKPSTVQPAKPKPGGLKGFIAGALPLVGGAVGATLGSFVAPLAGTAAGGAAGSGAGTFLKQKLLGEDTNLGEVGKEAALGAVPGVLKGVAAGARGVRSLMGGVKAADTAADVSRTIPTAQTTEQTMLQMKPSITQRAGRRLTESGSGLKAGNNVGDAAKLDEQSQFMSKYVGTPRQQRQLMEKDMTDLSTQVDDILARTPVKVDGRQVGQRLQQASTDLTDERFVDLDLTNPSVQKIIERYSDKFAQAQDGKGVNDIVKTLNKTATRAADKLSNPNASPLTAQETAALALKRAGDDVLGEVTEIAPLKKQMAHIFDVTPQVARAGEKGIGVPFVSGVNMKAPVQMAKGIQSKVGATLQGTPPPGAPPATGGVPTGFRPYVKPAIQQGVTRAVVSPFLAQPEAEQPVDETGPQLPQPDIMNQQLPQEQGSAIDNGEEVQKAYLRALQAGDKEAAQLILAGFEKFGAKEKKPLSAEASKVISNANSGLQSLDELTAILNEDPSARAKTVVPGRSMFGGAGASLLGTSSYDTAARNIADVITRLRTGAALTESEEKFYTSQLPQAFDPPETVAQKMQMFRNLFTSVAGRTGTAGTDTQSAAGL